jgi:hypothetical protein
MEAVFRCTLKTRHFLAHPFSSSLKGAFGKFLRLSSSCRPLHKLEVRYWLVTSAKILPQPAVGMEKDLEGFWGLEGFKHRRAEIGLELTQLPVSGFVSTVGASADPTCEYCNIFFISFGRGLRGGQVHPHHH